jgi:hypothetical protein
MSSGTPEVISGLPKMSSGLPKMSSGTPEIVSGTPEIVSGFPEIVSGVPGITSGKPEIVSNLSLCINFIRVSSAVRVKISETGFLPAFFSAAILYQIALKNKISPPPTLYCRAMRIDN